MFGTNPVRKPDYASDTLWVQKVFRTIQGEGPLAGCPAIFVRLAGCNLRCWFCDTDFESSDAHLSVDQLLDEINALRMRRAINLVVLTGGEPLRQNIAPLARRLFEQGVYVQVETAGIIWPPDLAPQLVHIVCSPKTGKLHPYIIEHCTDYKYIVKAGEQDPLDGLPMLSTQLRGETNHLARPPVSEDITVWVQPMDEGDPVRNKLNEQACLDACYRFGYQFSFQVHKAIGVE
jgi:organic radical activating enzyme